MDKSSNINRTPTRKTLNTYNHNLVIVAPSKHFFDLVVKDVALCVLLNKSVMAAINNDWLQLIFLR